MHLASLVLTCLIKGQCYGFSVISVVCTGIFALQMDNFYQMSTEDICTLYVPMVKSTCRVLGDIQGVYINLHYHLMIGTLYIAQNSTSAFAYGHMYVNSCLLANWYRGLA